MFLVRNSTYSIATIPFLHQFCHSFITLPSPLWFSIKELKMMYPFKFLVTLIHHCMSKNEIRFISDFNRWVKIHYPRRGEQGNHITMKMMEILYHFYQVVHENHRLCVKVFCHKCHIYTCININPRKIPGCLLKRVIDGNMN